MLKRLIGIITVKDGWAVQSFSYSRYLPLGRPEVVAENYDRWQIDEILVVDIDRSRLGRGPNLEMLRRITNKRLSTPLCYMGGIRDPQDALAVTRAGADRVAMDALFRSEPEKCQRIADAVGRQAVIRALPIVKKAQETWFEYDHITGRNLGPIDYETIENQKNSISELMVTDVAAEGNLDSFNHEIVTYFQIQARR